MASGINSTFRQVGIATGIAALGAVFQSQILHRTTTALAATPAGQQVASQHGAQLQSALTEGDPAAVTSQLSHAGQEALFGAYKLAFAGTLDLLMLIGAIIALVGSIGAFVLVRQRDFATSHVPSVRPVGPEGQPAATGSPALS
jgi:hypothetical protein